MFQAKKKKRGKEKEGCAVTFGGNLTARASLPVPSVAVARAP